MSIKGQELQNVDCAKIDKVIDEQFTAYFDTMCKSGKLGIQDVQMLIQTIVLLKQLNEGLKLAYGEVNNYRSNQASLQKQAEMMTPKTV